MKKFVDPRTSLYRWDLGSIWHTAACLICLSLMILCPSQAQETQKTQEMPSPAGTPIYGGVLGNDGKPMTQAVVEVLRAESRGPETGTKVGTDGRFRVVVPGTGLFLLRCSGVRHAPAVIPLLIEGPDSIRVDVRLAAYSYLERFADVRVIGSFNRFSYNQSVPMQEQKDGTYTAVIPVKGDSVAYELIGVERNGRSVPGTSPASYIYDGGGDFASLIPAGDSVTVVTFNPRKLMRGGATVQVRFDSAHRDLDRYRPLYDEMKRLYVLEQQKFVVGQQLDAAREQNRPDFIPRFRRMVDSLDLKIKEAGPENLISRARKAEDGGDRDLLLLTRLRLQGFSNDPPDASLSDEILNRVPPLSPWWSLDSDLMALEVLTEGDVKWKAEFLQTVLDKHPDPGVRAAALLCFISRANKEKKRDEAGALYKRMQSEFIRTPSAQYAKLLFNPAEKIREGEPVPDFSCVSLDPAGGRYTNKDFAGKTLLLDFWATWCGPCVSEMPAIHAVYDKYKGKGLEILSLSFDKQADKVGTFRAGQWKMPWKNGFVEGGFDSPIAKAFEITAIPKPILVSASGTILATGGKLRGKALDRTLERAFRAAGKP